MFQIDFSGSFIGGQPVNKKKFWGKFLSNMTKSALSYPGYISVSYAPFKEKYACPSQVIFLNYPYVIYVNPIKEYVTESVYSLLKSVNDTNCVTSVLFELISSFCQLLLIYQQLHYLPIRKHVNSQLTLRTLLRQIRVRLYRTLSSPLLLYEQGR